MPIAITSELRNQPKVLYRFDRGGNRRFMSLPHPEPIHVLETLANNARCCVLSTRVGARSVAGPEIREEPIAYLLDNREANNDPTNFRVFLHHAHFAWRSEPVGGRWAGTFGWLA